MRTLPLVLLAGVLAGPAAAGALPPAAYAWSPGVVFAVTTAPGRVTDIALEPGETLAGTGPVAAGDTARWIIGQSESGAGAARQAHVLVKPTAPDLATNLIVATDRRSYHLELRSTAAAWTPVVSWRYPAGELIALRGQAGAPAPAVAAPDTDLTALNFGWRIEGEAPFRPLRVFDDGKRTYVDFPPKIAQGEMPPLVLPGKGDAAEPVNVRIRGTRMIVDRLFAVGELRLGDGRSAARVRLVRESRP